MRILVLKFREFFSYYMNLFFGGFIVDDRNCYEVHEKAFNEGIPRDR